MPMPANQFSLECPCALLQMRHEDVIKFEPLGFVQRHDLDGMVGVGGLQSARGNISFKPVKIEAQAQLLGLTQRGQKRLDTT